MNIISKYGILWTMLQLNDGIVYIESKYF